MKKLSLVLAGILLVGGVFAQTGTTNAPKKTATTSTKGTKKDTKKTGTKKTGKTKTAASAAK